MKEMLNTKEICQMLKVSRSTMFRYMDEGMPRIKLGYRTIRFNPEEVAEWVAERNKHYKTKH